MTQFDHTNYVPCLRWKQGEYQAVLELPKNIRDKITPLIEIPEIEYDHSTEKLKKTLDNHISALPSQVWDNWGSSSCFIDFKNVKENLITTQHYDVIRNKYLETIECGTSVIPVISVSGNSRKYIELIKYFIKTQDIDLCIRVSFDDFIKANCCNAIQEIIDECNVVLPKCHFIIDLETPTSFEPIDQFSNMIIAKLKLFENLDKYKTLTILSTSFPSSMGVINQGENFVKRLEWILYKKIIYDANNFNLRIPTFGDYVIHFPKIKPPRERFNPRTMAPSATIRYTITDNWYILKGKSLKHNSGLGFAQYFDLSRKLVNSEHYMNSDCSWGDKYILDCSKEDVGTGNLTTWRKVGTNHHITKVVGDIANLFDS